MIFSIFDVEKISSQLAFTQSNLYYQNKLAVHKQAGENQIKKTIPINL